MKTNDEYSRSYGVRSGSICGPDCPPSEHLKPVSAVSADVKGLAVDLVDGRRFVHHMVVSSAIFSARAGELENLAQDYGAQS